MLTLADALEALTNFRPIATTVITEAVIDSRQVIPGCMFVAVPGEKVDGHDFIEEAFRRGASFALIQRDVDPALRVLDLRSGLSGETFNREHPEPPLCLRVENTVTALQQIARYWRRKLDLRVVGITGSVGKSTTKEMVAEVLSTRYRTLKSPGNLNNEIGLPISLLQATPAHDRAVLEMGFYVPGEIALLCEIARPQVGVVTNVSEVHLERAGSLEAIIRGKSELVENLPPAPEGVAILNIDDEHVRVGADADLFIVEASLVTPDEDDGPGPRGHSTATEAAEMAAAARARRLLLTHLRPHQDAAAAVRAAQAVFAGPVHAAREGDRFRLDE